MQKNKIIYCTWCQLAHPAIGEILANASFDYVTLDCEHGEAENAHIAGFCRAVISGGAAPLVRVMENSTLAIRRALDLGAAGVIVPLVEDASSAEKAVASATYPPAGIRGFAWHKANRYGVDFDTYAKDFRPLVLVMCESVKAVENIDSILRVKGVDGVVIGPYDLSGSMGIPGRTHAPEVTQKCADVAAACRKAGKYAGVHIVCPTPENIRTALDQGYNFIALGMDTYFLIRGAAQVKEMIP